MPLLHSESICESENLLKKEPPDFADDSCWQGKETPKLP